MKAINITMANTPLLLRYIIGPDIDLISTVDYNIKIKIEGGLI